MKVSSAPPRPPAKPAPRTRPTPPPRDSVHLRFFRSTGQLLGSTAKGFVVGAGTLALPALTGKFVPGLNGVLVGSLVSGVAGVCIWRSLYPDQHDNYSEQSLGALIVGAVGAASAGIGKLPWWLPVEVLAGVGACLGAAIGFTARAEAQERGATRSR